MLAALLLLVAWAMLATLLLATWAMLAALLLFAALPINVTILPSLSLWMKYYPQ